MTTKAEGGEAVDGQLPADQTQQDTQGDFDADAAFDSFVAQSDEGKAAGDSPADDQQQSGDAGGDAPKADAAPASKTAAKADAKTAKDDEVWAGVDPEVRQRLEARFLHMESSERGRVSHLQRELTRTRTELESLRKAAPKPADKAPEPTEDELLAGIAETPELKKLAEDYPDLQPGILKAAQAAAQIAIRAATAKVGEVKTSVDRIAQSEAEAHKQFLKEQADLLENQHPDYLEVAKDRAFRTWVEDQPRAVRDAFWANAEDIVDAKVAGDILASFKAFRAGTQPGSQPPANPANGTGDRKTPNPTLSDRRRSQLDGAAAVAARIPPAAAGLPDDEGKLFNVFADMLGGQRRAHA